MKAQYYALINAGTTDGYFTTDDDGIVVGYATEADAIVAIKDECCDTAMVVKTVARVTQVSRTKIEKFK